MCWAKISPLPPAPPYGCSLPETQYAGESCNPVCARLSDCRPAPRRAGCQNAMRARKSNEGPEQQLHLGTVHSRPLKLLAHARLFSL